MIQMKFLLPAVAAASVLAGCMPAAAPQPVPATAGLPSAALPPVEVLPASGISGLEERQPDLCGARNYVGYLSQPGSVIPTLGIAGDYRVVEFRGIEPQEYKPQRIVFRLDASGNIYNIDCG